MVQISVLAVVILLFVLNIILEHLFNWWFRNIVSDDIPEAHGLFMLCLFGWVLKSVAIFVILDSILP